MAAGIEINDRRLLWAAAALALAIISGTLVFAPAPENRETGVPSSYSTSRDGAEAAYLLLQESGVPVFRSEQPPQELFNAASETVLVLADPQQAPVATERRAVVEFVRRGGRVLFCGGRIDLFFGGQVLPEPIAGEVHEIRVNSSTSPFVWNVRNVATVPSAHWRQLSSGQSVLFGDAKGPLGLEWKIGKGTVIWWASATPLTNSGIRRGDNLQLFLNAVTLGSRRASTVYWDEYFHGSRKSLWGYVGSTPLRWLPLQAALLCLVVFAGWSRRRGPIFIPRAESRLSPLEFVEMLGSVYRRARATDVAIEVERNHLRLALARKLGVSSQLSDEQLATLAEQRFGWKRGELEAALAASSQPSRTSPTQALSIVQGLLRFDRLLQWGRDPA